MSQTSKFYQGTGKTIQVRHDDSDLPNATEIAVYVDSCPQVIKTLTGGDITNVTTTTYELVYADADFQDIKSGEYRIQAKITPTTGPSKFGRMRPSTARVVDTVFTPVE